MTNLYTTTDLSEARYLTNYKFHGIVWIEYKKKWPQDETNDEIKVYISYENSPELMADVEKYKKGDTVVHLTDEQWRRLAPNYRYPVDE